MRIALLAVCILAGMLFMEGCGEMDQYEIQYEQAINNTKDFYLAHMEEKYDMTFLPISYSGSGLVTNEEFRCYAEGTDRERDYISVFRREENGEAVYYDDYFGILIRAEYEKRVDAVSDQIVGNTKSFVHRYAVSYFDNTLTGEYTLDDAINMGVDVTASKYIFFELRQEDEETFQQYCDRIEERLSDEKLTGFIKILGLAPGELQNIHADNYLTYLPSMVKADGRICLLMANRNVSEQ